MEFFASLTPVAQVLIATGFTWGVTALGAATVFLTQNFSRRLLDGMLGFAAGVMIAASFWSLLAPAIELSAGTGVPEWLPALVGFLLGAGVMRLIDFVLPHLNPGAPLSEAEGVHTEWRQSALLIVAITMHNIPEGLAIGVAFGAAALGDSTATLAGAVALALGIGLQNFPEGIAVSVPLRRSGMTRSRSFFWGQLSATVEPVAGLIGLLAVAVALPILPYALSFAAGAMIFIVVEEVIPEAQRSGHKDFATIGAILGFAIMMTLDVALG